jgi:hypothetical protein
LNLNSLRPYVIDMGMFQAKLVRFLKRRIFPLQTAFWEYSGRISTAADYLKNHMSAGDQVLDVGGSPGNNLLRSWGIQNVTVLDLNPKADIVASAENIPAPDGNYAFVTCLDTMEHIPQELRSKVVSELVRVASKAVILIAPQDTEENRRAEELVLRYVQDPFLLEHKSFGLMNIQEIESNLAEMRTAGVVKDFTKREIDNLLTWTCLMTEDCVNSSKIYREAQFLENGFFARRAVYTITKN